MGPEEAAEEVAVLLVVAETRLVPDETLELVALEVVEEFADVVLDTRLVLELTLEGLAVELDAVELDVVGLDAVALDAGVLEDVADVAEAVLDEVFDAPTLEHVLPVHFWYNDNSPYPPQYSLLSPEHV